MKQRSKLLSILLSLALAMGMIPAFGVTVDAANSITNLKIDANGVATWDAFPGAAKYSVENVILGSTMQTETKFYFKTHLMLDGFPSGNYELSVSAYDSSNHRISSVTTATYTYTSKGVLDKPVITKWDGIRAEWNEVPNATGYRYLIWNETEDSIVTEGTTDNTWTTVSSLRLLKGERYSLQITAENDNGYANNTSALAYSYGWYDSSIPFSFTSQPKSGQSEKTQPYSYSWKTNYPVQTLYLQIWNPAMKEWQDTGNNLIEESSSNVKYIDWISPEGITKYRLHATFGGSSYYSNEFTVKWIDYGDTPHTITVDDGTADKSTAKSGETVTISAKEKENFTFTGWTAYTDDARSVSFADRLSPNTTFIMPDCDVRIMPNYKYSGSVFTDFYVYITPPVPGEHPQAPIVNTDDYSVSAYNWIETTDTGSSSVSRKMTSSDVFKEGIFYQCRVDLLVKDGIVGEADELKGYVNGSTKTDGMDVITSRNGSFKVKVIGSYNCSSAKANPFVDVSESDYFYEPVLWAVGKGITNGTDATHFSPSATCTRGQVVTFLWRAAGSPAPSSTTNPFTDVSSSDYYYNAVLWAVGKNITNGTSPTTFGPNDGCTRGQVVTFLHRFENTPTPASSTNPFVDVSSSEYYYTPVLWAVGKGITNGTDSTHFSPNDTCTRGQIVTFLYRDMK